MEVLGRLWRSITVLSNGNIWRMHVEGAQVPADWGRWGIGFRLRAFTRGLEGRIRVLARVPL